MREELILRRDENDIRILQLNRPEKLNALSMPLMEQLLRSLDEADADESVRGVIVTGHEKAFSTGVDLNEALEVAHPLKTLRWLGFHRRVNSTIEALSKPVVALIQGHCYTGGLEIAMACDLRVAEEGSRYAITSSRIGSVAGMGGTQRLPRIVGRSAAKDLLLSGRFIEADEAYRLGLVDRLCPRREGLAAAIGWLSECAARGPLSVWLAKWAVNTGMNIGLDSALDLEGLMTANVFMSEDRVEGMRAVLEKRSPKFVGR